MLYLQCMKYLFWVFLLFPLEHMRAQFFLHTEPLAHTYSIVAYDPVTGDMGVAVQSHWFATGSIVTWGEAGVGVVATQSFVNPSFGPEGLRLMKEGMAPEAVVRQLTTQDEGRGFRQLAVLDSKGRSAAYTGKDCIAAAGHQTGQGYSVQANMMKTDAVWPAMAKAFEASSGKVLAERLLLALEAAEAAGGDIRGRQSAALLVVSAKASGQPWVDRKVDLRVDDHQDPLGELRRLLGVHTAYQYMNQGDVAVEQNQMALAMELYTRAQELQPQNEEMVYWTAVTLVNTGQWEQALPLFRQVFRKNQDWKTLTPRLVPNGLLKVSPQQLETLMGL
jgi:uncharacterized Ntn-hydrolase superfamily protein